MYIANSAAIDIIQTRGVLLNCAVSDQHRSAEKRLEEDADGKVSQQVT